MLEELIIDSFAGGGGASLGIEWATGRSPDVAINHKPEAIKMHAANHPDCVHVLEDVWKADLKSLCDGRPVGLLWASPDCRDFSRAKGGQPVSKGVRSLAWIVIRWAVQRRPRVIILENVREFAEWGPLVPRWACAACKWKGTEGQVVLARRRRRCPRCESLKVQETTEFIRDPKRLGLTFKKWVGRLRGLGYKVEWKNLDAADYGAPTHRKRLFLVARCDGAPIEWPEPTHTDPKKAKPDLFGPPLKAWRTAAECIDWSIPCPSIFTRKKELRPATLKRIAHGIKRYVLDTGKPFIVRFNSATSDGDQRGQSIDAPTSTLDTSNRLGLVVPTLVQTGYGERDGQAPRVPGLDKPLGTVVSGGGKAALVSAFLAKHYTGVVGVPLDDPTGTITATDHHSLVTAHIQRDFGASVGHSADDPLGTVTSGGGGKSALVAANLVHANHASGGKQWTGIDEPARTVTTGNHAALVYSFLVKYFGTAIGQPLGDPLHTVTAKDRFGVVTVMVDGEPYAIVDIGMRMLHPRELARAQGFPDDYKLSGVKSNDVARIGNSVCPPVARAMVEANYVRQAVSV